MKLSSQHWRILLPPAVLLIAVGAAAAVSVSYTTKWRAATAEQLQRARANLAGMQKKTAQVDQERLVIERYRDAYENLRRGGAIGAEQRVNWLDALRVANHAAQTLGVDYQVSQQAAAQIKLDLPGFRLRQTSMKLDIKLLQEEDLMKFLGELGRQSPGLYLLQSCALSRIGGDAFSVRFEAKLRAECDLAWLSLEDAAPENGGL